MGTTFEEPFGGAAFRDRFTDAVWQGPTWSLSILLVVLDLRDGPTGGTRVVLVGGFALVMVVTVIAVLVHWERVPPWTQVLLPLGDLLGASLMTLAATREDAPTTLLLCSLPVIWLAFEFGRTATAFAVAAIVVIGLLAFRFGGGGGEATSRPSDIVVPVLFVAGVAIVARLMRNILGRIGDTLRSQASGLASALELAEARLIVMTGVMESIDAGVTVLRPGLAPLHNERAAAMALRAGTTAQTPHRAGDRVYSEDGITPVPATSQAAHRAVAGEEFAGLLQWIGEPGDQLAQVTSARQLTRADGERLGTVLAAWDATELMNAIRIREEFVTTVSHELRTPLTAITASLELLVDLLDTEELDVESSWLLSSCTRNAGLLDVRVSELLSSADATPLAFEPRRSDVTDVVRASLAKHDASASRAGVGLVVDLEADIIADLDPARFEQIVDNVVSNAVKYTASGGTVSVSLHRDVDNVVLTVVDTGVGMTPDEQRQAFVRFYRAPGVKATAVQGLGIGLGLVKSIVELHQGSIELASSPGIGTTVSVVVPIIPPVIQPVTPEGSGTVGTATTGPPSPAWATTVHAAPHEP